MNTNKTQQLAREMSEKVAFDIAKAVKFEVTLTPPDASLITWEQSKVTEIVQPVLAQLLADKERLDWLERELFIKCIANKTQLAVIYTAGSIALYGDDLRTAIDNHMKEGK